MKHKKPKHKRGKRYPEPGAWVDDRVKDMPRVSESTMAPKDQQLTAEEIRDDYIAYGGLGYCVYDLIPPNCISDPQLRQLWFQARNALFDIVSYLQDIPEQRRTTKKKLHASKRTPTKHTRVVDIGDDLV